MTNLALSKNLNVSTSEAHFIFFKSQSVNTTSLGFLGVFWAKLFLGSVQRLPVVLLSSLDYQWTAQTPKMSNHIPNPIVYCRFNQNLSLTLNPQTTTRRDKKCPKILLLSKHPKCAHVQHTHTHGHVPQRIPVNPDQISMLLGGRGGSHSHLDCNRLCVFSFTRAPLICPPAFIHSLLCSLLEISHQSCHGQQKEQIW